MVEKSIGGGDWELFLLITKMTGLEVKDQKSFDLVMS